MKTYYLGRSRNLQRSSSTLFV